MRNKIAVIGAKFSTILFLYIASFVALIKLEYIQTQEEVYLLIPLVASPLILLFEIFATVMAAKANVPRFKRILLIILNVTGIIIGGFFLALLLSLPSWN